jgi:Gas vesicle synthesis protein GvpL/GvpF
MMNVQQPENRLLYLYGIIQNSRQLPDVPPPVEPIVHGKLVALVESVPAIEFSPEVLETQFTSLDWVTRHAEKHESLVAAAMRHGPVIPARFCTLFSNGDAVRKVLSDDEERLWGTLARLDGMAEWSIRAYCNTEVLERGVAERDVLCRTFAQQAALTTPGQAYVLSKRRQSHIAYLADTRKSGLQEEMLDELDNRNFEVQVKRLLPPSSPDATQKKIEMVANLVVLASTRTLPQLVEMVNVLAATYGSDGFTFERTGPWPPYSFTQYDSALDDDGDEGTP